MSSRARAIADMAARHFAVINGGPEENLEKCKKRVDEGRGCITSPRTVCASLNAVRGDSCRRNLFIGSINVTRISKDRGARMRSSKKLTIQKKQRRKPADFRLPGGMEQETPTKEPGIIFNILDYNILEAKNSGGLSWLFNSKDLHECCVEKLPRILEQDPPEHLPSLTPHPHDNEEDVVDLGASISRSLPVHIGSCGDGLEDMIQLEQAPVGTAASALKEKLVKKRPSTSSARKQSKLALNSGEPHQDINGLFMPGKKMKGPCNCRMKCFLKINEEQRLEVHNTFWKGLGDKMEQWAYIYRHSPTQPKKVSTTGASASRRANTRKYFLAIIGAEGEFHHVQVCKVMFTNTLTIGDGVIGTAHEHCHSGTVAPDKRGKHTRMKTKT